MTRHAKDGKELAVFRAMPRGLAIVVALGRAAHAQDTDDTQPGGTLPPAPPMVPEPAPEPAPSPEPPAPGPSPEVAAGDPVFGSRGTVVINGGFTAGASYVTYDGSEAQSVALAFGPGFDWFVTHGVSIGLGAFAGHGRYDGYAVDNALVRTELTSLSVGPRVGVNVPFGETVSFYPRLTLGIESLRRDDTVISSGTVPGGNAFGLDATRRTGPYVFVSAPLLFHFAPHVFIGLGPTFSHSFGRARGAPSDVGPVTVFGGEVLVGAHWGGERNKSVASFAARRRFGEAGQSLVTSEVGARVSSSIYEDVDSYERSIFVAPGYDAFVGGGVSLGIGGAIGQTESRFLRAQNVPADSSQVSFVLAPRMGFAIPLGDGLTLYPRLSMGFGYSDVEVRSGSSRYAVDAFSVTLSAYAPLLFHFVPHAFVGFGPYASAEIVSQRASDNRDLPPVRRRDLGARLVLGLWW